jgi:hypothetical protein
MLTDEQEIVAACTPRGHRYTLVLISIVKRSLEMEIPSDFRLKFLEHLDRMPAKESGTTWLTAEMVAGVDPICNKAYEIVDEARKLGASKALDIYADQFPIFAGLNPSLMNALKQSPSHTARSA